MKDIENEKWIEIYLVVSASSSAIVKGKKEMQEHAEKLNWILDLDKKGTIESDGFKRYNLKIKPKEKFVSPDYLFENHDLIFGSAEEIVRDILSFEEDEQIKGNYSFYEEKENIIFNLSYGGVLHISGNLKKWVELENKEPNLSKKIFFISIKEDYLQQIKILNKRFSNKKERGDARLRKEYFEKSGMQKTSLKNKKRFDFF
jgi:hypothetical protein|tara:strand:+ start:6059 stop:6664 length:606 start_codon:yes stop_codon:yes gene_type:complete